MKSLFDPEAYEELVRRLDALRPDAPRQWGKMRPSEALEHVARALEMASGERPMKQAFIGKLIGWKFRKDFLGEKPFMKNAPTAPHFVVAGSDPDFHRTKERLKQVMKAFHAQGERGCDANVHGFLGKLTGAEWGVSQYKHVDHHLRQFGA